MTIKNQSTSNKSRKSSNYPFLNAIISEWKSRCKNIKYNLKDLALDANITPPHLTKIITGKIKDPTLGTINDICISLAKKEAENDKSKGK
tara:strand:+ start:133 stop:402 length:270 start_codon:yes stop_codon:yes gene_type:complete